MFLGVLELDGTDSVRQRLGQEAGRLSNQKAARRGIEVS